MGRLNLVLSAVGCISLSCAQRFDGAYGHTCPQLRGWRGMGLGELRSKKYSGDQHAFSKLGWQSPAPLRPHL